MNVLDLDEYYATYSDLIRPPWLFEKIYEVEKVFLETKDKGAKITFSGNGASAAIAAHLALDTTKQAQIRAVNFHDAALITAFANDFGYDKALMNCLKYYADPQDIHVFISVSGESPNVVHAAEYCRELGYTTISFTGCKEDNSLAQSTDISFWVDSSAYNIVECIHMIWLTTIVDRIIGKSVYKVS